MSAALWLIAAAAVGVTAGRAWLLSHRYRRLVAHWCALAEATGSYVFVPSRPSRWERIWMRHTRTPFVVRVELDRNHSGETRMRLISDMVFGGRISDFDFDCDSELDRQTPETSRLLAPAVDKLLAARGEIERIAMSERKLHITTRLDALPSLEALNRCLDVAYAVASSDDRVIETMRSLPLGQASAFEPGDGTYPRVVVAVPTPVELSIRSDHNLPRTVATAVASRLVDDFSCDIGANGKVQGRPAELIPEPARPALPRLAMCRLRKRGGLVELFWPRVESDRDVLLAGARLVASFQESGSPYR